MLRVQIESPFAGDVETNTTYARAALRHSLDLGEAPYASHLLYPQVYDDSAPAERQRGIDAGYEYMQVADIVAFYIDRGWSPGMIKALKVARLLGRKHETRTLYGNRNNLEFPLI
jgi:hypothetical protein